MEGLVLLLLLALGGGGRPGGNGNGTTGGGGPSKDDGHKGPASVGPVPPGNPPGGCRLVYGTPESTLQALAMLGYTPLPEIWGPDEKLGTYDADVDPEIRQFQLDYNHASRTRFVGSNAGGLTPDGLMGKCGMAAIAHVMASVGANAWRDKYMPAVGLSPVGG